MKQYLNLLQDILDKGTWKVPARENLPPTLSLFGTRMEFDMADGFPLLTTKEVHFKSIVVELLWFLKGDTNIKYLVDNGCNIWNQDAYRWYLKLWNQYADSFVLQTEDIEEPYTLLEFIDRVKREDRGNTSIPTDYYLGDLGKIYGRQWRDQNGIDQIQTVLDRLQSEPEGRYAILDAWNPADFSEMALPPCHLLYQFNCRKLSHAEKIQWVINNTETEMENLAIYEESCKESTPRYYLDLQLYQRSCDTLLGVPFNIASGSLLLHIIAKIVGMEPGKFIWVGGDTHIYENHMDAVKEQLSRTPTELPSIYITPFNKIEDLQFNFFDLQNYHPQSKIKGELNVGLKK